MNERGYKDKKVKEILANNVHEFLNKDNQFVKEVNKICEEILN